MYKALTNYEVTEQHICCAGEWTETPFDMLWQHVVVRNFYKNALGQKVLSIGTINTSLQWKSEPLLYTATAFQQWLNTKGAKKHLYVRHGLMHDDAVGTQRCRVKKLSMKLTCSGAMPGPDNHESAAAGANFV